MSTLALLKWMDSKGCQFKFQLVRKVSSKWRNLGRRFGREENELDSIEHDCPKSEHSWCKVMDDWLNACGTAEYPATWRGLLTALEDIECHSVARELERVLSSVTPPPSPQPLPPLPTPPASPPQDTTPQDSLLSTHPVASPSSMTTLPPTQDTAIPAHSASFGARVTSFLEKFSVSSFVGTESFLMPIEDQENVIPIPDFIETIGQQL